jgi:hypothetical protein
MQSSYLHFETPKMFLKDVLFVEFVSELQFTELKRMMEGIIPEFSFPFYLTSTRFISAIYSIPHLILP